ncbi:unannotated protein [freshwater metagenome]|uniref:Unannotated protein n=1 Tax=freshwater metagenome TaxID=449393 RepID=A0A6J6K1R4_9ZZZZ
MHSLRSLRKQGDVGVTASPRDVVFPAAAPLNSGFVAAMRARGEICLDANNGVDP